MVYGCGNKCVKFFVFFVNFLVFVFGIVILTLSLLTLYNNDVKKYFQTLLSQAESPLNLDQINIPLYVLAGVGGLLILTGFLGCCGAWCENTCLLALFFAIILILFVSELACGIAILVKKDSFQKTLYDGITNQVEKYYKVPEGDDLRKAIDEFQKDLQCCGCNGPQDYPIPPGPPSSCAGKTNGCCEKAWSDVESQLAIAGGVALGILVVELLAMIFACILCQAYRRNDGYQYA